MTARELREEYSRLWALYLRTTRPRFRLRIAKKAWRVREQLLTKKRAAR